MKKSLKPPGVRQTLPRRGQKARLCSIGRKSVPSLQKLLFSLRPPGVRQTLPRRGQKARLCSIGCKSVPSLQKLLFSLRKCYKLLKSLGIFTPPPPPALRHKSIIQARQSRLYCVGTGGTRLDGGTPLPPLSRGINLYCVGTGSAITLWRHFVIKIGLFIKNACPANRGGFSLVETLVATAIGSVLAYGVLRVSLVAVQTAQVAQTVQIDSKLSVTISRMLSIEKDCRWNLKPSRLSDTANKKGTLPAEGWKRIMGIADDDSSRDSTTDPADVSVLKTGDFDKGQLSIKSLELLKGGTDAKPTYTFAVFYTKPRLSAYKTLGGEECDPTASPPKKQGCYSKTCDLTITHKADNSINTCKLEKCHEGMEGWNVSCPAGEYLHSFTATGISNCKSIHPCADGEVISGVWTATDTDKPADKAIGDPKCSQLTTLEYDFEYDHDDDSTTPQKQRISCDSGKVLNEFYRQEGDPVCIIPCVGGQQWDSVSASCQCPTTGKPWDSVCSQCEPNCSSGFIWRNCRCECNQSCGGGYTLNNTSCRCECTRSCGTGYSLNRSRCRCERTCNRSCSSGYRLNTSSCSCESRCSSGQTWNGSTCVSSNTCWITSCSAGYRLNRSRCVCESRCPSGQIWSSGICCPSGQHNSRGICCPNSMGESSGICCPYHHYNAGGICCPRYHHKVNGRCVRS